MKVMWDFSQISLVTIMVRLRRRMLTCSWVMMVIREDWGSWASRTAMWESRMGM